MDLRQKVIILSALLTSLTPVVQIEAGDLTIPIENENYFVGSLFDHDIPDYTVNNNFIIHNGARWTDGSASPGNCTLGINCYDGHNGVDFDGEENDDIIATADGIVREIFWNSCGGNTMRVRHTELGYSTLYAHLNNAVVGQGSIVTRFQHIAEMGETGSCSDGVHVHFGVADGDSLLNKRADPYGWDPDPDAPVQDDPCEDYSSDLCVNLGYLWTTNPPSLSPPNSNPTLPVIPVPGTISEDTTWVAGNVYLIQGETTVEEGVTLTLEPGAIVKFKYDSSRINIYGHLDVEGTPQNKVYFTSYKDDSVGGDSNGDGSASTPAVYDWRYININLGSVADIDNAVIRYGGYLNSNSPGALLVLGGVLSLNQSIISNNRVGIYMDNNGYTNISESTIANNLESGISMKGSIINLEVSNSVFSNNGSSGISTNYSSSVSTANVSIENSTFSNNNGFGFSVAGNILNLIVVNTDFENNLTGDGNINVCSYYYNDRILNFTNHGNTTSGTGGNGFHICGAHTQVNQFWNPGVPFVIGYDGFTVEPNTTLTVGAGTIVKFNGLGVGYNSSYLSVGGMLSVKGFDSQKVYFTSFRDDSVGGDTNGDGGTTLPAPEDYVGINITGDGFANIFNAVFRYGGRCQGQYSCQARGVISPLSTTSKLNFYKSTLSKNKYGIYSITNETTNISNSTIKENNLDGILVKSNNANLYISDSIISQNGNFGVYMDDDYASHNLSITKTKFSSNQSGDVKIGGYQSNFNFVNSGNTTGGTGKNGFYLSGSISGDQVWNPGVPFVIFDVIVPSSTDLVIKSGVVVKFQSTNSYLQLNGNLSAHGSGDLPGNIWGLQFANNSSCNSQSLVIINTVYQPCGKIYFTSYKDDSVGGDSNGDGSASAPAPEDYSGIMIGSGNLDISKAFLKYGGRCLGVNPCHSRGVVSLLSPYSSATINSSTLSQNKYGVYRIFGEVTVNQSSIKDNTAYGIFHTGSGANTQAQNNFWGDATGPYNPTLNPGGNGNQVSNNVEFIPWLLNDPL